MPAHKTSATSPVAVCRKVCIMLRRYGYCLPARNYKQAMVVNETPVVSEITTQNTAGTHSHRDHTPALRAAFLPVGRRITSPAFRRRGLFESVAQSGRARPLIRAVVGGSNPPILTISHSLGILPARPASTVGGNHIIERLTLGQPQRRNGALSGEGPGYSLGNLNTAGASRPCTTALYRASRAPRRKQTIDRAKHTELEPLVYPRLNAGIVMKHLLIGSGASASGFQVAA